MRSRDRSTWARDDPLKVQVIKPHDLYENAVEELQSNKRSYQQKHQDKLTKTHQIHVNGYVRRHTQSLVTFIWMDMRGDILKIRMTEHVKWWPNTSNPRWVKLSGPVPLANKTLVTVGEENRWIPLTTVLNLKSLSYLNLSPWRRLCSSYTLEAAYWVLTPNCRWFCCARCLMQLSKKIIIAVPHMSEDFLGTLRTRNFWAKLYLRENKISCIVLRCNWLTMKRLKC